MDFKEFEEGTFFNADCMDVLKDMQDKQFDLCLTDPPYGIDYGGQLKGCGDGGMAEAINTGGKVGMRPNGIRNALKKNFLIKCGGFQKIK